jgi:hypothetical protein
MEKFHVPTKVQQGNIENENLFSIRVVGLYTISLFLIIRKVFAQYNKKKSSKK